MSVLLSSLHCRCPVQSHRCITYLMTQHQSGITAVNVIKEMLQVGSRWDSSFKMQPFGACVPVVQYYTLHTVSGAVLLQKCFNIN